MLNNKNLKTSKNKSLELLHNLSTPKNFLASLINQDNYQRVFARDGIISGISSLYFNDEALIETFKQTLLTLRDSQDETGRIASNVTLDGERVSYGTTVGRIDSTIWCIQKINDLA